MKHAIYTCLILMAIVAGCKGRSKESEVVANLKKDDATFLALKDTAQKHLPQFIAALAKKEAGLKFIIKSDFVDKGTTEHMWSQIGEYRDGKFNGIFIDSAFNVKNINPGDRVSIDKKRVEDWAIYNDNNERVAGAFSEKYLKSKLHN